MVWGKGLVLCGLVGGVKGLLGSEMGANSVGELGATFIDQLTNL